MATFLECKDTNIFQTVEKLITGTLSTELNDSVGTSINHLEEVRLLITRYKPKAQCRDTQTSKNSVMFLISSVPLIRFNRSMYNTLSISFIIQTSFKIVYFFYF